MMLIQARIKPNSKEFKIDKKEKEWIIRVKSKPDHNEANLELIKELKKRIGGCRIIKGHKSRNKIIEIPDI